jgi:hypothetical protein
LNGNLKGTKTMLSQKTALNVRDIMFKLKNAPLEAYTTPAGALGGVLLTKLLKRRPELRHYLAGGALGAGAGYAGGRLGRHFLEGYKKKFSAPIAEAAKREKAEGLPETTPPEVTEPTPESISDISPGPEFEETMDVGDVDDTIPDETLTGFETPPIATEQPTDAVVWAEQNAPNLVKMFDTAKASGNRDMAMMALRQMNEGMQRDVLRQSISASQASAQEAAEAAAARAAELKKTPHEQMAGPATEKELFMKQLRRETDAKHAQIIQYADALQALGPRERGMFLQTIPAELRMEVQRVLQQRGQ